VTAYGFFEAYGKWGDEPISNYTRALLFQEAGTRTDVALRFSTVIGGRDSVETVRDPRGFAIKFYTEDGNWDLVGNNLGVFFIRDAIKFPDVIHSLKPDPVTFRQEPKRIFDFMPHTPEAMHMLVNLFSPRGIPADFRHMQGFGVNTYKWVTTDGHTSLVKYHWMPRQGVKSLTEADAARPVRRLISTRLSSLCSGENESRTARRCAETVRGLLRLLPDMTQTSAASTAGRSGGPNCSGPPAGPDRRHRPRIAVELSVRSRPDVGTTAGIDRSAVS